MCKMNIQAYEESLMKYSEYVAHKQIQLIVPPILLAVGTLGNLFSFLLLMKNVRKASTYSYLSVLALMDLLVLYIGLFRHWIGQFMIDVADMSNLLCKIAVFLGYFCSDTSVWLIVAVTIERSIVVMFPLKAPRLCSARNARISIASIIVFFILVNCHFLWSVQLLQFSYNDTIISKCQAKLNHTPLVEDVWPWVDAGIYSFVPFLAIIILNIFIIKNVISAKNTRKILRQHSSFISKRPRRRQEGDMSKKITFMLLAVSFTFLITTLPMNAVLIYTSFAEEVDDHDDLTIARRKLTDTIAEMLMYANHSVNFFLYCATGKKFRKQFKALICCSHDNKSANLRGQSKRTSTASYRLSKRRSTRSHFVVAQHADGVHL